MRHLILALLAATVATAAPPTAADAQPQRSNADRDRYRACIEAAQSAPDKAIAMANDWWTQGGGPPARHCLAIAYLSKDQFGPAATALEQAAQAAERVRDPAAPDLWGQAGNAALLANDYKRAHALLSSAIVASTADGERRGDLLIDRSRAAVELNRLPEARADLDTAVKLLPRRPEPWLFRATVARRTGDLTTAASDIAQAATLAPDSPDVQLEQGNIAAKQGRNDAARAAWQAVVKAVPNTPAGVAAAAALKANGG